MESFELEIITNGAVISAYTKASRFLVNKHRNILEKTNDNEKLGIFKNLWQDEFGAKILNNTICFQDSKKLTLFNIKFS